MLSRVIYGIPLSVAKVNGINGFRDEKNEATNLIG
jgi:hypothetical protein